MNYAKKKKFWNSVYGQTINPYEEYTFYKENPMRQKINCEVARLLQEEHYVMSSEPCTRNLITALTFKLTDYENLFTNFEVNNTSKIDELGKMNGEIRELMSELFNKLRKESEAIQILAATSTKKSR